MLKTLKKYKQYKIYMCVILYYTAGQNVVNLNYSFIIQIGGLL